MADPLDLADLEKVDLHRHLEGSIRSETAFELGRQSGALPAELTLETFRDQVVVTRPAPLLDVLEVFDLIRRPIQGYEAVARIADEAVEDAAADRVRWLNLRFSPVTLARSSGLSMADSTQTSISLRYCWISSVMTDEISSTLNFITLSLVLRPYHLWRVGQRHASLKRLGDSRNE